MHGEQEDKVAWPVIEVRAREKGHSDRSSEAEMSFLFFFPNSSLLLHDMCLKL